MNLNRTQLSIMATNVLAFALRKNQGIPLRSWKEDLVKSTFGLSKSFFFNKKRGFLETTNSGNREFKNKSIRLLCLSTGIRFQDLVDKVVNQQSYPFDNHAKAEFIAHKTMRNIEEVSNFQLRG